MTNFLNRAYSYAKDKFFGKTTSLKEKYTVDYFSRQKPAGENYFERGLEVVSAFRAAKKYGKPVYSEIALSKFDALQKELSKDEGAHHLATDIWLNVEAYQATGDENYARAAKKDADVFVDGMLGDLGFVTRGKESHAEDQLLSASALLQLYELYPKAENYKTKAEGILDFFEKRHAKKDGGVRDTLEVELENNGLRFRDVSKNGNDNKSVYLKNLAALTYMNAHRITSKYGPEAKRFFSYSDKSLLLYSEASKAFKMKEYSKSYGELLKHELGDPESSSASNLAGVIGEPAFNVEPADPGLFRELLGVNFAAALGIGFVGTILPFYMASVAGIGATWYGISLGATCLANVVTQPYIGKLADRVGEKTVLAAGLAAYAGSILLTPGSIANYQELGLVLTSMARGVSGSAAGPPMSSLVSKAVPASQRAEAFAKMGTAYSAGYAVSSFASGPVYEHMKLVSEFGNFVPFVAAAFLPAALAVKLYSGYRKKALRMKTLDSIFGETKTEWECEPPAAVEQAAVRGASAA